MPESTSRHSCSLFLVVESRIFYAGRYLTYGRFCTVPVDSRCWVSAPLLAHKSAVPLVGLKKRFLLESLYSRKHQVVSVRCYSDVCIGRLNGFRFIPSSWGLWSEQTCRRGRCRRHRGRGRRVLLVRQSLQYSCVHSSLAGPHSPGMPAAAPRGALRCSAAHVQQYAERV